jgi:hypothetical protein
LGIATPQEKKTMILSPTAIAAVDAVRETFSPVLSESNPDGADGAELIQTQASSGASSQRYQRQLDSMLTIQRDGTIRYGAEYARRIEARVAERMQEVNRYYQVRPQDREQLLAAARIEAEGLTTNEIQRDFYRLSVAISVDTDPSLTSRQSIDLVEEVNRRSEILSARTDYLLQQRNLRTVINDLRLPVREAPVQTSNVRPSSYEPAEPSAELFELIPTAAPVVPVVKSAAIAA